MSWGSTGFTPIVTYNQPPFGFAELPTPSDFKTNPSNPWVSTEDLKADLNKKFKDHEKELCCSDLETFTSTPYLYHRNSNKMLPILLLLLLLFLMLLRT